MAETDFGAIEHSGRGSQLDGVDHAVARQPPNWRRWLWVGVITLAITATSMLSPYFRHQWEISLGRQPTPYTELSFNDATTLPTTAERGKVIHVSFTIANETNRPIAYRYAVASGSGREMKFLGAATSTVAPGASWAVTRSVVPECSENTCRVQVTLPQQNERIDFILALEPKTATKVKKRNAQH